MKRKAIILAIYAVLILIIIGIILSLVQEDFNGNTLLKGAIAMAACISALVKLHSGGAGTRRSAKFYEREYSQEIAGAFSKPDESSLRKKLLYAIGLYNQERYEKALRTLKELLPHCQDQDDFCAVLLFTALVYSDMGLTDAAIQTYRDYLNHNKNSSTVWSNLGLLFKEQGKSQEAFSCFDAALKLDPENAYAHNNISTTKFALGDYEGAIQSAKRALELKSNLYQASNMLCILYRILGNTEESEKYYNLSIANGANAQALQAALEHYSASAGVMEA